MKKLTKAILFLSLAFASGKCLGDWTDAGWHVWYVSTCGAGSNVVEVLNMNKLSFREYAFNRLTGALKRICWNTSKAEEFYVNGESEISLTMNGEKAKLEFVSMTEMEDEGLEASENGKGKDVLATVESRFVVPSEDIKVSVTYRFRRDNEVRVDCAVVARRALPADSRLSVAYPISRDYTTIAKRPQSGDEVREVRLYSAYLCRAYTQGERGAKQGIARCNVFTRAESPHENHAVTQGQLAVANARPDVDAFGSIVRTFDDGRWLIALCLQFLHTALLRVLSHETLCTNPRLILRARGICHDNCIMR